MAKILIVQSEFSKLDLDQNFSLAGHIVETAANAEEAKWLMRCSLYDLVIAEWRQDGIAAQMLRYIQRQKDIPSFIALSSSASINDKVDALEQGADDFLVIPFSPKELRARVNCLLRRAPVMRSSIQERAGLHLDTIAGKAFFRDKSQELSRRECALLETFLRRPDQVISAETLLRLVWPSNEAVSLDALRQNVYRLRMKLQNLTGTDVIRSAYGIGYEATLGCLSATGIGSVSELPAKMAS